ncbi:MAG TPA: hypothetical protein VMX16_00430 [Terriglobia bacterium]|nr:hypothetical protein [Terriglobia bacterium]
MRREIRPGEIWKDDSSGDHWLVTKVYTEAFDSYAFVRRVSGNQEETRRLSIVKSPEGASLPGFTLVMA